MRICVKWSGETCHRHTVSLSREKLHKRPRKGEQGANVYYKVIGQYATLGSYDFVTIIEAPDNETIAHLSVDLSSRVTVRITTLPAIPNTKFRQNLKGRKQIGKKR